jgi:hypothetical protein
MGVLLFKGGVGVGMLKWQTSGFPPLREGNRARVWFPLLREGNRARVWFPLLREGNRVRVRFPCSQGEP